MTEPIILVTGGAGFIGSCFVRLAIGKWSVRVVNFDKLTYAGNLESLGSLAASPLHQFVEGDIADPQQTANVFDKYQPTAVVHFAAESHVDRSIDDPGPSFVRTNVQGTFHAVWIPPGGYLRRPTCPPRGGRHLSLPARLDRRSLRVPGAQRPFPRNEPLRSQFALFGLEGGRRPLRPGVFSHVTACRCW